MAGPTTPSEPASPGQDFLTPRTKLARMLAAIDNEMDNAPSPPPTQAPAATNLAAQRTGSASDATRSTSNVRDPETTRHLAVPARGDPDSEDSDDNVRQARGRAAGRIQRADMMSSSASPPPQPGPSSHASVQPAQDDSDDDLYSATPMKPKFRDSSPLHAAANETNGLFVSPNKTSEVDSGSEDELPTNPLGSKERLAELIAQKRAERLAKESEAKQRKQMKKQDVSSSARCSSDLPEEAVEGPDEAPNPDIEKIMSDASRPARKASKKALLEMERETQRLARQQALAHQMKVKKKFTTTDLFARFNMKGPAAPTSIASDAKQHATDSSASSAPNSDGIEERQTQLASTPPSSPPTPFEKQKALVDQGALSKLVPVRQDSIASLADMEDEDDDLPDLPDALKAPKRPTLASQSHEAIAVAPSKGLKLARLGKQAIRSTTFDSDDDDLEILPRLPRHLQAFERAQGAFGARTADSKAIHNLRHLAHLNYDDAKPRRRKGARPSISHSALEASLRRQAREQARQQHLERIEELRAKGIEVQTVEDREREAEEMEDLLEKARAEAQALRKIERKKAADEGAAEASEDEDEDFDPEVSDEDGEASDIAQGAHGAIDNAAEESDEDEDDVRESSEDEEASLVDNQEQSRTPPGEENGESQTVTTRRERKSRVVADDDDDDNDNAAGTVQAQPSVTCETPQATSSHADPFAAFGFHAANGPDGLLSPTQAFNATMQTPTQDTQEDSFDILRRIAPPTATSLPPTLPEIDSQTQVQSQSRNMFSGSQVPESQRIQLQWETQAPETPRQAAANREESSLSETPTWEPTQDRGLQSPWTVAPKLHRDDTLDSLGENDTQSTMLMRISESPAPSPHQRQQHRKLTRRFAAIQDSSEDEPESFSGASEKRDAFREMARKRKEAMSVAEREEADRELRGMMEDQAEESEDEYAGLGGDDYVAPETEADREIIDSSAVDVDERALAAHYAERERERNEAETSRLYKDLTTGVLRRKMGANAFDLEEDEDELAVRRRRLRQQEEAKKRKALLKDDNVKTLAEGKQSKGKDAFLKAIADDDGDEEMIGMSDDDEDAGPANATQEASQTQPRLSAQSHEVLQETSGNKRRLPEREEPYERPAAKQRRTAPSVGLRRPTSMLEIQESVSFLLDEPQAAANAGPTTLDLSDSEHSDAGELGFDQEEDDLAAEADRQNDGGFAPNPVDFDAKARKDSIDMPPPPPRLPANQRRTAAPADRAAVIDRLSLKRASSTSDTAAGGHARAAWNSNAGFKVPSLLRRATTNSGANERGVTINSATGKSLSRENSGSGIRQGGSKKSSLAYQARVEERKAIVEASARRREENTKRIAAMRRQSSGTGAGKGWAGAFE